MQYNGPRTDTIIRWLEHLILYDISVYIVCAPYFGRVSRICIYWAALFWLIRNILRYHLHFYRGFKTATPLNKPLFLFLAASILSTVLSVDVRHSQSILFERYVLYFVFYWIGAQLAAGFGRKPFLRTCFISLTGAVIISALLFAAGGVWDYWHNRFLLRAPGRFFTVFGRRIAFGMFPLYTVYFIPFGTVFFLYAKRWLRLWGICILLTMGVCWFFQGSRSAWVSIMLVLIAAGAFIKDRKFLVLYYLLLAVSLVLFFMFKGERILKLDTLIVRGDLVHAAYEMFKEAPLAGQGLGMYEKMSARFIARLPELHAHSLYFELLAEMGTIGLLSFLSIFVLFFKKMYQQCSPGRDNIRVVLFALSMTICASLLFGVTNSIVTVGLYGAPLFWLFLGIAGGLLEEFERRSHEGRASVRAGPNLSCGQ